MSYPDFPPPQPDPYRERRSGRPQDRRPGPGRDDDQRGYGASGGRSRDHGRGEADPGRGSWGPRSRGYDDRDRRDADGEGYGGRRDRARGGDGGSRDGGSGRGSRSGPGSSRSAGPSRDGRQGDRGGYGYGYGDGERGDRYGRDDRGEGGRGWQGSRAWPGARDKGARGARRPERADSGGGRGDFWGEDSPSRGRGFGRRGEGRREAAEHGAEGREQWARRGATALRDRYRDATDWFQAQQQQRPQGILGMVPFLSRWGGGRGGRGGSGGWDGRGPGPRRKGDWWRRWTWKKALAVVGAAAGVLGVAGVAVVAYEYSITPIPALAAGAQAQASTVYFSDGKTVVGRFGQTNRVSLVDYNQIPQVVVDAFLSAEDKNFFHEGGVSPTGIMRAVYQDLTSSSSQLQGGSTITQELVRNYYTNVGFAQTFNRKIKEIFIAEKVAQKYSKQWVLLTYLNTINFGSGTYGLGAAAEAYFRVPVNELNRLTPAQAALLTALPNDPNGFSLDPKAGQPYQALVDRWNYVLDSMVKTGDLSPQARAQQKFPATYPPVNNSWNGYNGYIMQAVQYELQTTYHYSNDAISNDGLSVVTTFNKRLMDQLYASVQRNRVWMHHNVLPSPMQSVYLPMSPSGLPGWVNIGAVLENPHNGAIEAMYSGPNYLKRQEDMALESRNQVGSSFKPYVLATAVQQGMSVFKSKLNGYSPLWIPPDTMPSTLASRKPVKGNGYYGPVTNDEVVPSQGPVAVMVATAESLNTAFTDLYHRVALGSNGQDNVVNMAASFGVDTSSYLKDGGSGLADMAGEAGIALGQASLTVEEQATMIATLADNGIYHAPHVIKEVINGSVVTKARPVTHQVLTAQQAAQVQYAMSYDTQPGLGTAPNMGLTNGQVIIAKTGTTNLAQQAFFLGATPNQAMAVGMFVNDTRCPPQDTQACQSQQALNYAPPSGLQTLFGVGDQAGYGGEWPAMIWHTYFMKEFNRDPVVAWPAADPNYGTPWILARAPKPKPKPKPTPGPSCFGNGRHCKPSPSPTITASPVTTCPPAPFPCPTTSPSSTATPSPATTAGTLPAGALSGTTLAGSAVAGTLLFGGLTAVALPARRRRRPRR